MAITAPSTQAWREVLALFDRWADADEPARAAELKRIQAEHPTLYPRLLAMIEADRAAEAHDFLAEAAQVPAAEPPAASHWTGTRLGAWELREPIGSGGMGHVWRATRSDGLYAGRAAVKLLHSTRLDAQAQARFAREGEFLARLTHPHIAQLLDAGLAPDGTRYLVLEYVPGERIDHWCDARKLGIEARLKLFMQVCEAVAYAHSHLVVHRDLKPANILVTDDGHVKLLDFGVAKLLAGDDDLEQTELTRAAPAGLTPEYAAPEQIEGQPITTATDVYALGVVLFGLLSGARPYASTSRGVAALARAIVEEPPRSLTAALRESPDAGLSRNASLASLQQALRGDLETIVAKALKKLPSERYATVQELRDDLQRHLDHQPVSAQPDTFGYRARKFAQRNRVQVAALAGVMLTLVLGITATAWQWRNAAQETDRTKAVIKVLTNIFTDLAPEESGKAQVPVVDLLRKGWSQAKKDLETDPALRGEVARPLGLMLQSSGDMTAALDALTISRQHLIDSGQTSTSQYLQVMQGLAYMKSRVGQTEEAKSLLSELTAVAQRMGKASAAEAVNAQIELGEIARREGKLGDAETQLAKAVALAARNLGAGHPSHIHALQEQAVALRELGRWSEARCALASAVESIPRTKPVYGLLARYDMAIFELDLGQYREAANQLQPLLDELRKYYGEEDTYTIYGLASLAIAHFHSGELGKAEAALNDALQRATRSTEPNVRQVVQTIVARHALRRGQCALAEPLLRENLVHFESGEGTSRPFAERNRMLMAECELRRGQVTGARAMLDAALENQHAIYGPRHADIWPTLMLKAIAVDAELGAATATPLYESAHAMAISLLPEGHPDRWKVDVMRAQARWRSQPTPQNRAVFATSLRAYGEVLATRPDSHTFSVLSQKLLEQGPTVRLSPAPLLALMAY
ncbi:serine/threonine-protein kinase [Piscinibacter sp. HJYY11]|uniref:serine/threonine-protein kinase n=1 Tax=Piscinibacter sp. HJYY11 TaxID=2801333 RepID=UPI00191ED467|nr:serine/threonine-protein kinase [Piscinibacter sp. HJYY11]MBL0730759.1 serine/threonine protein kinase [Piscinibacter sp. HJYY11]